jgi:hypothetical protein
VGNGSNGPKSPLLSAVSEPASRSHFRRRGGLPLAAACIATQASTTNATPTMNPFFESLFLAPIGPHHQLFDASSILMKTKLPVCAIVDASFQASTELPFEYDRPSYHFCICGLARAPCGFHVPCASSLGVFSYSTEQTPYNIIGCT